MSIDSLKEAVKEVISEQKKSKKPLAIILAGHNGSGKTTMWYKKKLADMLQIPLINADRMMTSILPPDEPLPSWAKKIRDENQSWMKVAQKGVESFVVLAMANRVAFAMETVFSHWKKVDKSKIESKIDLIYQMQDAGYFVLLMFVGLSNRFLSQARVQSRFKGGGHNVNQKKLNARFPRTQKAIRIAAKVSDASILLDNSLSEEEAFTVCRVQINGAEIYDQRRSKRTIPTPVLEWLDVVCPIQSNKEIN